MQCKLPLPNIFCCYCNPNYLNSFIICFDNGNILATDETGKHQISGKHFILTEDDELLIYDNLPAVLKKFLENKYRIASVVARRT